MKFLIFYFHIRFISGFWTGYQRKDTARWQDMEEQWEKVKVTKCKSQVQNDLHMIIFI